MNIFIVFIISLILSLLISILLHELGHLICGRLSGYKFVSFRLMKWLWTKNEFGKLKLTKNAGISGISGQCLMEPPANEKDFRFVLYSLGGGLFNIMTGLPLVILYFFVDNELIQIGLLTAGLAALYLGIVNIIPMTAGAIPNDGKNIIEALKSADARLGLYIMLKVNAEMSKGKRLQDYDQDAFTINENTDVDNYFVANMILLRSSQLEELGAYEESYNELLRLVPAKLPPFYSSQLILSMMFKELVVFGDEESVQRARERIQAKAKDKLFQQILQMKHPTFLASYATKKAFLDNDTEKARELIAEARKLNSSIQNPGEEYSVSLMLDRLEAKLKGSNFYE